MRWLLGLSRGGWRLIAEVFREFIHDDCVPLAGSLAFFTLFSFPPILALVVDIASLLVEPELARAQTPILLENVFGEPVGEQARLILREVRRTGSERPLARLGGIGILVFAATMILAQAQQALNRVWGVRRRAGLRRFLIKRLISLSLLLGMVLLLLLSLAGTTALGVVEGMVDPHLSALPEGLTSPLITRSKAALTFATLALVCSALHQILPEARVPLGDALIGGLATAALLTVGQEVIGWVIATAAMGSAFGAARSLALLLFWVFYSAGILLWGAELTKVVARRRGHHVDPVEGASRVPVVPEPPAPGAPEPPAPGAPEPPAPGAPEPPAPGAPPEGIRSPPSDQTA
ncbi:MAG TPA: YihY/virulence factor BrkB family protein [Deltaproteobacteria bacterium]|nr:YihY/virulence factor BrkB family protein [Deltaproteobacteria bacterium]